MTQIKTKIPAELEPAAVGGMVTDSKYVKDRVKNKTQEEVNADTEERVSTLEESVGTGGSVDERIAVEKNRAEQAEGVLDGKVATEKQRAEGVEGGLNTRLQTVEQLATISVGGGDIGIGTAADFESDDPSDLAKVPTVGAMLGGANDGVYDISARHSGATYADLAAALGTNGVNIPQSLRKGGMSVKFVQSSDNNYVQYMLRSNSFTTDIGKWQKIDNVKPFTNNATINSLFKELYIGGTLSAYNFYHLNMRYNSTLNLLYFYIYGSETIDGQKTLIKTIISNLDTTDWMQLRGTTDFNFRAVLNIERIKEFTGEPYYFDTGTVNLTYAGRIVYAPYIAAYLDNFNTGITPTVSLNNNVYYFDINFNVGEKYYIKLVSGDGNGKALNIGSSGGAALKTGEWVEYTAPEFGQPYIIVSNPSESPVIEIININSVSKDIIALYNKTKKLDNIDSKPINKSTNLINSNAVAMQMGIQLTGVEGSNNTWYFNTILEQGTQYYVKLLSGDGNGENFNVNVSVLGVLKLGSWAEITATEGGDPYIISNPRVQAPVIQLIQKNVLFDSSYDKADKIQHIKVTASRYGTSGVDADFCGLNAIGDAIASIQDASENKIYDIYVNGHFLFTEPSQFIYQNPQLQGEQYCIAGLKKYVNLIGVDKNRAILEVAFNSETVFPSGMTYMKYQPIYLNTPSEVKNLTIIGDACRYVVHIEYNTTPIKAGEKLVFENCVFISKDSVGERSVNIFGTGGGSEFDWLVKDCVFRTPDNHSSVGLGYHTNLSNVNNKIGCSHITMVNCDFNHTGTLISANSWTYNRQDVINIISSRIGRNCREVVLATVADQRKELDTMIQVNIDNEIIPSHAGGSYDYGIRITGNEGTNKIRFALTTDNALVLTSNSDETILNTDWGAIKSNGYEYKDSTNGKNAYACSYQNISPTDGTSIGARLGDCSSISKTLRIVIDDVNYDVVFNQDMTNVSNDDIITAINNVISAIATCDTFNPSNYQFPKYRNVTYGVTTSEDIILKGMGVVFDGISSVRKAVSEDVKIDGIALDTIAAGQIGRIGGKGYYTYISTKNSVWNAIYPTIYGLTFGDKLSISIENPGQFLKSDTNPVMRVLSQNCIELL